MTTLSFSLSLISARFSQWRGVRKPVIRNLTSVPPFSSASLSATVGRILKKERTVPGVVADPGAFPRGKHGRPLLRPTLEITFLPEANVSRSSSRYAPVRSFVRSMPRAAAARAALWRLHKPRTIFWLPWERRVCTSVVRQREQRERERERGSRHGPGIDSRKPPGVTKDAFLSLRRWSTSGQLQSNERELFSPG